MYITQFIVICFINPGVLFNLACTLQRCRELLKTPSKLQTHRKSWAPGLPLLQSSLLEELEDMAEMDTQGQTVFQSTKEPGFGLILV